MKRIGGESDERVSQVVAIVQPNHAEPLQRIQMLNIPLLTGA
jgi:hypothetical protein